MLWNKIYGFVYAAARFMAVTGGVVLALLALLVVVSIIGGAVAKMAYTPWVQANLPLLTHAVEAAGIRTLPGLYELMMVGTAFCVFAFLPLAQIERSHAVVDVFTGYLPRHANQLLITLWEVIFLMVMLLITWRLYDGIARVMRSGVIWPELAIAQWWGYALAFGQMVVVSAAAALSCWAQLVKLHNGTDLLAPLRQRGAKP